MLRFVVRALGFIALAWAFAAAVMDGARSIANSRVLLTPLGATMARLAPERFQELPSLAARIHPKLWDPVLIHILYIPTFVALAIVGLALTALAPPQRGR
jgi:hypothetical protein